MIRIREQRSRPVEERGLMSGGMTSMGYGLVDPSAIPPPNLGAMQRAGVYVTQKTLLQVDVVFTALRIISNHIIGMGDLRAYEERLSDDNIIYKAFLADQPAILTDTWAGRHTLQCTGMDRTVWSMALFGESFWYVLLRDRLEYASTLEVLHPAFMEVKQDENGDPIYIYGTGKNKKQLEPENVIHIPLKSLPGARRGLSPVDYAGVAGALAMAAYEFGSAWFSQGASPSFILSTDQKLGQEEVQRIAQKFLVEHSGLGQAHLPLVLDSGLKAEKMMASPDEAQYLNTLEYARNVIASWFGIPASKLPNALQRQPAAPPHTRQEEQIGFQQDTLSGYTIPISQAITLLLPPDVKAGFDEDALSKPDAQFLAQEILAFRTSQAASINDVRVRKLGWAPVKGGDDVIAPLASNTAPEQTKPQEQLAAGELAEVRQAVLGLAHATMEMRQELAGLVERRELVAATERLADATDAIAVREPSVVNVHPSPAPNVTVENRAEPVQVDVHIPQSPPTPVMIENRIQPADQAAPIVNFQSPDVHVHVPEQPAPVVNVQASEVQPNITVEAPDVTVVPEITVETPRRRTKTTVQRDQRGQILSTETEEQ